MLLVVNMFDTLKKRLVEHDVVLQISNHRQHLFLNVANFGGLVRID